MNLMQQAQTSNTSKTLQRRKLGIWMLSGIAATSLAACGGGGGGDSTISLRQAYDQMQKGLTRKQAEEIVGRTPKTSTPTRLQYDDGTTHLSLGFTPDSSKAESEYLIDVANWYTTSSPSEDLIKSLA